MFHNFLIIEKISEELRLILPGFQVVECFSQNKDELIISFLNEKNEEFYIRASLSPSVSMISFPGQFHRARKNSVDLFPQLIGKQVHSVINNQFDRSFYLTFDQNTALVFKLHGNRSNVILFKDARLQALFISRLKNDKAIDNPDLSRNPDLENPSQSDISLLEKLLGKQIISQISGYESSNDQGSLLTKKIRSLRNSELSVDDTDKPTLTFADQGQNPLEACNKVFHLFHTEYQLKKQKDELLKSINGEIKKTKNYLVRSNNKLQELKTRRSYEDYANILMANLHNISPQSKSVELEDFYLGGSVTIKLKKELSPQKNAEQYYRKAKNEKLEIKNLEENIFRREADLDGLNQKLHDISNVSTLSELKPFQKKRRQEKESDMPLPYQKFGYMGYEIRVGKNARHNDELTFKHTRKNDLWLHARDVAGSHVVIKNDKDVTIPQPVIEYAGALAAYFSKNRTEGLASVSYTEKKYVRKPKGLPPGKVIMDREKVIMVKPIKP